jgi:hypothetical protein
MLESVADRYRRWGVDELLAKYPELRIIPSAKDDLKLGGELEFNVRGPDDVVIADAYCVELRIPPNYPEGIPTVFETGGRVPKTYHKLTDGSLCLAAPTELRLRVKNSTKLEEFVELFVIPYLFGFSYREIRGVPPYGELEHGKEGLREYFAHLFDVSDRKVALQLVRLASLKKKPANKLPCPCGSGRRLGRCHHAIVNELRSELGRRWFASHFDDLAPRADPTPGDAPDHSLRGISTRRGRRQK